MKIQKKRLVQGKQTVEMFYKKILILDTKAKDTNPIMQG